MFDRLVAALVFALLSSPAFAQDEPRFDLSGAYSVLRNSGADVRQHGWTGSGTGYVQPWLGITAEANGHYSDWFSGTRLSAHTFLVGSRVPLWQTSRVTPFVELLAGIRYAKAASSSGTISLTTFAYQSGGGVDLWVARRVGVRGSADYRRYFGAYALSGGSFQEVLLRGGIVVRGLRE